MLTKCSDSGERGERNILLCLSHLAFLTQEQQENMKLPYLHRDKLACVHKCWTQRVERGFKSQKGRQFEFSYISAVNKLCFPNVDGEGVGWRPSWWRKGLRGMTRQGTGGTTPERRQNKSEPSLESLPHSQLKARHIYLLCRREGELLRVRDD